ncbi:MAG: hypothetical protein J5651_05035 [Salinivirgaceae bacterium]|nr:hypothetical protein [Salinivirgaceae bacterium]
MEKTIKSVFLMAVLAVVVGACQNNRSKQTLSSVESSLAVSVDTVSQTIKFGNTLFSLPSPYQLTMMVKNADVKFNESLMNPVGNNSKYTSQFQKCVNLGVYGADLAYLNIYEQMPLVMNVFSVAKVLANDLDLLATFNSELVSRVEKNIDNNDSLLYIMTNTYRDIDIYLKESHRQKEGALILAGGWVEAMYILTQLAVDTKNQELIQHVGESKQPLDNLVKILTPYYSGNQEIKELLDSLMDLTNDFEGVEQSYTYKVPEIDAENKVTVIKSVSKVVVKDADLQSIAKKIKNIRTFLVK